MLRAHTISTMSTWYLAHVDKSDGGVGIAVSHQEAASAVRRMQHVQQQCWQYGVSCGSHHSHLTSAWGGWAQLVCIVSLGWCVVGEAAKIDGSARCYRESTPTGLNAATFFICCSVPAVRLPVAFQCD